MSDKPIAVGDLVMVVRPSHCGCMGVIGRVFRVTAVSPNLPLRCIDCGKRSPADITYADERGDYRERARLIRINPDATGDSLPTRADIKETV